MNEISRYIKFLLYKQYYIGLCINYIPLAIM